MSEEAGPADPVDPDDDDDDGEWFAGSDMDILDTLAAAEAEAAAAAEMLVLFGLRVGR